MANTSIIALLIGLCATLVSAGLIDRGQDLADVAKYPLINGKSFNILSDISFFQLSGVPPKLIMFYHRVLPH